MVIIRMLFIFLVIASAFGCTATKVTPLKSDLELKHVCIQDGKLSCFDGDMLGVIRDGFDRHGISSEIYSGELPSECEFYLSYMCARTWDIAMYMHHAELRLYREMAQIGYAEYHLKGGGGFSLMKFESTKKKMDPVIDELLKAYPITN